MSVKLILGGARSGKSRFAESLAHDPKHYIATAQAFDAEMQERIRVHQVQRGTSWVTHEEPVELVSRLQKLDHPLNFILVDCLTLWLSNLLLTDADCEAAIQHLVRQLEDAAAQIVIVSNEVGLGIVPDNHLARRFRDIQGLANQRVASIASNVVFMAAGIPLMLKGPLPAAQ